jgi:hypothetical protein
VQDPLGSLFGAPPAATSSAPLSADMFGAPPAATLAAGFPPVQVFDKDGINVTFEFTKAAGNPQVTDIDATYSNSGPSPVTEFTLQVGREALRQSYDADVLGL